MNLKLTNNEFLTLLKIVYLADYVANGYLDPDKGNQEISAFRRKIFSIAQDSGFGAVVDIDHERDDYFESIEFSFELDKQFVDPHTNRVFWYELRERLTDKIMDAKFGNEIDSWSGQTYRTRRTEIEEKVQTELETNGLDNLFILGDFRI
ncbi:MAG TPA: hypothetical protein VK041_06070 [Opitutales bacterium]|nr:hypothetical protein [Opitutales bacterium]